MPITYQRLGNSGGGMVVEISAYPNTQITLSNEKNTYIKATDEKGKAVFKGLKAGTYTAMCTVNGKQFTQSITLVDTIKAGLPSAQIKGLPLKSKIKLSNGIKMILMNKNLSGHPANSATFVSEYIVECTTPEPLTYDLTSLNKDFLVKYYNRLNQAEKQTIILRNFTYMWLNQPGSETYKLTIEMSAYFWIPSATEVGDGRVEDGVNIGFGGNESKIKRDQYSAVKSWFLRTIKRVNGNYRPFYVDDNGVVNFKKIEHPETYGIVPACDISQDAYVALDSDGYYRILGM